MKKFLGIFAVCAMIAGMTSCKSTTPIAVTSNPVGNKCGVAETTRILYIFGGGDNIGIDKAAKNGGITRISHVDYYSKNYSFVQKYGVRVYGE